LVSFIGGGNRRIRRTPTDLLEVSDKLYHIMLYNLPWSRFELTTSIVIGTDCIGSCESNYHTTTATLWGRTLIDKIIYSKTCLNWTPLGLNNLFSLDRCLVYTGSNSIHLVDGTVKSVWFRQVFGLLRVLFRQVLLYMSDFGLIANKFHWQDRLRMTFIPMISLFTILLCIV
jgi:hypothetical protein